MQRFNLKGLWAYTIADGRGKVGCFPRNAKRFIDTGKKLGLTTNESVAFYVSGSDKVGALCKVLDRLDKASVNVKVMDAMGFSGRYGAYVWVDPQEVESAAKALGARQHFRSATGTTIALKHLALSLDKR